MRRSGFVLGFSALAATCLARPYLSEILFNPPGADVPNEYVELRGQPNELLSDGTYLVVLDGDETGNPGKIRNVFDLGGRRIGGNGFLLLLQRANSYAVNPAAVVLSNSASGDGFGSGGSSSIGHRGDNGQTDLENASATFLLIQATNPPSPGNDADADDNGVLDGAAADWLVLDSVGILGNHGAGDIAYGSINFRRNPGAQAGGTVVAVGFTPGYVGRSGNTTGSGAADWVASGNLGGTAPYWTLGATGSTVPGSFTIAPLNHAGGPNFGAPVIPGVLVSESGGATAVVEGGATDSFTVALTVEPVGAVTITVSAGPQLEISTNNGATFGAAGTLSFTSTATKTVLVRASDDNVVDTSPHVRVVTNTVTASADLAAYPLTSIVAPVAVNIVENDWVLLNELRVNPPGIDGPCEFVELRGPPNAWLTNIYFLSVAGKPKDNPGTAEFVANLSGAMLGSNGLLLLSGVGPSYSLQSGTRLLTDTRFNAGNGVLNNSAASFLLVSSPESIREGRDLDSGNNGLLEKLSDGTTILDAVAWTDGDNNAVAYGGAVVSTNLPVPDAAVRFTRNNTPQSAAAWYYGSLLGTNPAVVNFDAGAVSTNFPHGAMLTPGALNEPAATLNGLMPICGAVSDPSNPALEFNAADLLLPASPVMVSATSSNPEVVPDANLTITALGSGAFRLALNPVGVGYSIITVTASTGTGAGVMAFRYAASAQAQTASRFHLNGSDASTALALDSDWMLVGDDEKQIIRLFPRDLSGLPVKTWDPTPSLGLIDTEDGTPREVDLEASTRVGNRLFWLGSHSHAGNASSRVNRSRVFATDLSGSGTNINLAYVGRYDHLKADLIAWDQNNMHGRGANWYGFTNSTAEGVDPKTPGGFNIEGLTMAPGNTNLAWLGLRAPLVPVTNRVKALLVPVLNFRTLAVSGAAPGAAIFGAPIELNLGGRGIRSIEGNTNGVITVAAPPGTASGIAPSDFRIYTWTGNPADAPREHAADLSGMTPEALVELPPSPWTAGTMIQLISDNGTMDFYGDDVQAKHLPVYNFKKSRSDLVALGAVVVPRPVIHKAERIGGDLRIEWLAEAGRTYRVQWRGDWTQDWAGVSGDILATDATAAKVIPITPGALFFRVMVLP